MGQKYRLVEHYDARVGNLGHRGDWVWLELKQSPNANEQIQIDCEIARLQTQ